MHGISISVSYSDDIPSVLSSLRVSLTSYTEVTRNLIVQGKGKIAAQCGHAVAGAFTKFRRKQPVLFEQWSMLGQAKIALKVPTTRELVCPYHRNPNPAK